MPTLDADVLVEHLDRALDALVTARLMASPSPLAPALPGEALDVALRAHEGCQRARKGIAAALGAVEAVLGEQNRALVFDLEAAVNELVGRACETLWALAWTAVRPRS